MKETSMVFKFSKLAKCSQQHEIQESQLSLNHPADAVCPSHLAFWLQALWLRFPLTLVCDIISVPRGVGWSSRWHR